MSISNISGVATSGTIAGSTNALGLTQRQQYVQALAAALQSGTLAEAQVAFEVFVNTPVPPIVPISDSTGQSLQAQLGQFLASGNMAAAQTSFQALQAHQAGSHQQVAQAAASNSPPPASSAKAGSGTPSGPGSVVDTTA